MPLNRALLVDNDGDTLELVAMWLRARGFEVVTCESAPEALKIYRDAGEAFTLVVTDVAMPVMTGLELVKELRDAGETVPVLLITAFGDALMQPQAKAAGANGVLYKPFDSAELDKCVKTLLGAGGSWVQIGE